MSPVTRMWLAFAAICTGLIHAALAATAPLPLMIVLAALGLAELAWGLIAFIRDRIAAPVAVLAGALTPLTAWGLLVLGAAAGGARELLDALPPVPMAIAGAFQLFVALTVGRRVRNGAREAIQDSAKPIAAGRYVAALFAGALASAALVTPALAATDAGDGALPHGHGIVPAEVSEHPQH